MQRVIFILLTFFYSFSIVEAQQEGDNAQLSPADAQYKTLIDSTIQFVDKENNKALDYISKANVLAISLGDTSKLVQSGRIKAQLLRRMDRLNEAVQLFHQLLPIAKRQKLNNDYKVILNSLAIAYSDMASYDKALDFHFQSLVLREKDGNNEEISITLFNLGFVYYKLRNFDKAIEFYNKALTIKREIKYNYDLDLLLINIGDCFGGLKNYEKALEYYDRGLKICNDECADYIIVIGRFGIASAYFNIDKLNLAKSNIERSYDVAIKSGNKRFQAECLKLMGQIAIREQEYDKAIKYLRTAEQLAKEAGYNNVLLGILAEFSGVFKYQQNYEQASYYQDKYIKLKDSVFSDGLIKNLANVQSKFEERENIKIIANKDEELWQQRQLNIAVATIAVLSGLLVFLLYKINTARRKANERLDKEVQDATRDLREAYKLLAEVNKELDHFIYKTSHDIRGPLASLKGLCNVALADVGDPTALGYFSKIDLTASHLDTLLRRLQKINQINHATPKHDFIDFAGIVHEVEQMERDKGMPSNLSITYQIQPDIQFFSDRELIYLVLENLIDNAIKFHDSSKANPFVIITITTADQLLKIKVIDNGIGIGQADPEQLFQMFVRATERSASGGIGLYLSRRATEKLGGEIHMCTTPEGYTEFYVILPLETNML